MPAEQARMESFGPIVLAGLLRSHPIPPEDEVLSFAVARQWRDLLRSAYKFAALLPPLGYGMGFRFDPAADHLEFFCGFTLRSKGRVPTGLHCVEIPDITCARFRHSGRISLLRPTLNAIFETGLPQAGLKGPDKDSDLPSFILRARPSFSPLTGLGGVEILVPVKA